MKYLLALILIPSALILALALIWPEGTPEPTTARGSAASGLSEPNTSITQQIACLAAEKAVLEKLKSPTSAKFSRCTSNQFKVSSDGKTWWVFGSVSSQNRYGAMIRAKYGAKMYRSGDTFTAVTTALE